MSIWAWPTHNRRDEPPGDLLEAGRGELMQLVAELEGAIGDSGFVCGELSVADLSLFPHVSSLKLRDFSRYHSASPTMTTTIDRTWGNRARNRR